MTDPTFTNVTIRSDTAGAVADLLTLDSVSGAAGNGAALRFIDNSATPELHLALGRLSAWRVNPATVRLDLAVVNDPTVSSGDDTPPLLSLVSGPSGLSVTTAVGSLCEVGGTLNVTGAAALNGGANVGGTLAVSGAATLNSELTVSGAATLRGALTVGGATTLSGGLTVSGTLSASGAATLSGKLEVQGAIFAGGSDLYFTETTHNHTGIGNTTGYAAIENAADAGALMILGRAGMPQGRTVKLWDYLQVNGGLDVTGNLSFGSQTRQMINLWGVPNYGIGVQAGTQYYRSDANFAWYIGGGHHNDQLNGGGGRVAMVLRNGALGIGTATPATQLHVIGARIRLEGGGKILDLRTDGSSLDLESLNSELFLNWNGRRVVTRNFWYDSLNKNSSREYKHNIAQYSADEAMQLLPALTPVTFNYREDPLQQQQIGFIAEEMPEAIATADRRGVRVDNLLAVIVTIVRQQQELLETLRTEVAALRSADGLQA